MKKMFYPRLAAQNLKKNGRFYFPYILTVAGAAAAFYILAALAATKPESEQLRYEYLTMFMAIGLVVVGLFAVIFLFYTNGFLMKRRGRELGLYNVLGMGKWHIAAMLGFETLYVALLGIGGGIALGALLQKLMTMIVARLMGGVDGMFPFRLFMSAMGLTALLFGGILLVTLGSNLARVAKLRPVELMNSANAAEREPRTQWLLTVLGIGCLGTGYYLAMTVQSAMEALGMYFVAVFLVIIGTYCLFTSISIAVLKLLRRNKRYYYKTGHFIGISGMLYRMKRNAVGLANICILSTMVLVMVSGTLSLYLGTQNAVDNRYPADVCVEMHFTPAVEAGETRFQPDAALEKLSVACEKLLGAKPVSAVGVQSLIFTSRWTGSCFETVSVNDTDLFVRATMLAFLPAKDYAALTGRAVTLKENEVLLAGQGPKGLSDTLMLDFRARETEEPVGIEYFQIAGQDDEFSGLPQYGAYAAEIYCFVVADETVLDRLWQMQELAYTAYGSQLDWYAYLDTGMDAETNMTLGGYSGAWDLDAESLNNTYFIGLYEGVGSWESYNMELRDMAYDEFIAMNGGFFFLGIFLGLLFLLATVLIIYYKQISEGYEDRERFRIMQQVGLQKREIRRSINHQLLVVFFAPLLVAAVHIAFDFRFIRLLLLLFQQNDGTLVLWCSVGSFAAFAALYWVVYRVTARAYYRIVE